MADARTSGLQAPLWRAIAVYRIAALAYAAILVVANVGDYERPVLAWPVLVLVGMAFATVVFGISARMRSEEGFGVLFRLGVFPLFLFSGAFFPVDNLDDAINLARTFTDVVLGTLQDAQNAFATDGDSELVSLIGSIIGE